MPLYQVQDADRPMYVWAKTWMNALNAWKQHIAIENGNMPVSDVEEPLGIMYVAEDHDVIIDL